MGSTQEHQPRFETLQLHAGYVGAGEAPVRYLTDSRGYSQEPDPATKARAVPIYATTVGS